MYQVRQKPLARGPSTPFVLLGFLLFYGILVALAVLVLRSRFPETRIKQQLHPPQQTEPQLSRTDTDHDSLLHAEPVEGIQDKTLLTMELCQRVNSRSIKCWGYVSNLRDESSKVSLQGADIVDGKGNSFNLSRGGEFDFQTGPILDIPAQSRVKYTIIIPDEDQRAKTLTFYLDISNPRDLEYTFRNVPVAD